jgi:glutamine amidotransferase
MIALINYGSGNLRSVHNALVSQGADVQILEDPERLPEASAVVLPGVGAFGDCAQQIRERGFWEPVQRWIAQDRPFLGICVGYQMMFEGSEEAPEVPGFGFFKGQVQRFKDAGLKIPQIGWNALELTKAEHPLWSGLPPSPHVYFVHSFHPAQTHEDIITAKCTYGESFAASGGVGRVAGVQFHPEKSQHIGLGILKNFITKMAESN